MKLILISFLALAPLFASADVEFPNPLNYETFGELVDAVITWLVIISTPIIVLLIVIAGLVFMFSGANPNTQKTARNIIFYSLIGYAIILLAKVLMAVVKGVLQMK
jgi:hypothetical protein